MKSNLRSFFIFLLFVFSLTIGNAKELKYKVSDIPPSLITNAGAVVRLDETRFEINQIDRASLKSIFAVTILNKNGLDMAPFFRMYDKFSKISSLSATVYDENGKKIKRVPMDEILDYSAIQGYTLYDDNRVKVIDPDIRTYPFTVEYEYEVNFTGLISYPGWQPYPGFEVSVQESKYTVSIPKAMSFRYNECNLAAPVEILNEGERRIYFWQAKELPALIEEPYSLPLNRYTPCVITAPDEFSFDGYSGSAESWLRFGQWINLLNQGQDNISNELAGKLKEMVDDATTEEEKIAIIYKYLQDNTRYVSIQIGIGGWRPFDAETVNRLAYGDCKALSNYMYAMLKAVGINSYYVLVRAGRNASSILADFPSNQFNHACLCVPLENDTIWLECTSKHYPAGFVGSFTDDRYVLVIQEDGGHVAHTKTYLGDDNVKVNRATVRISPNSDGNAEIYNTYKGVYFDFISEMLFVDDIDKKRKLLNRLSIPNVSIEKYGYEVERAQIPFVKENLDLNFSGYGAKMGSNLFLPVNLMNRFDNIPRKINDRKSDVFIRRSVTEIDSITYILPENYSMAGIPKEVVINSDFGSYFSKVLTEDKKCSYVRSFKLKKGIYPKEKYTDLIQFFQNVSTADNQRAVLKKL